LEFSALLGDDVSFSRLQNNLRRAAWLFPIALVSHLQFAVAHHEIGQCVTCATIRPQTDAKYS
jgi:hypothetical protein